MTDQRVEQTMTEICELAQEAGKIVGTYADSAEVASQWIEVGVQYVAVSVDVSFLKRRFAQLADSIAN